MPPQHRGTVRARRAQPLRVCGWALTESGTCRQCHVTFASSGCPGVSPALASLLLGHIAMSLLTMTFSIPNLSSHGIAKGQQSSIFAALYSAVLRSVGAVAILGYFLPSQCTSARASRLKALVQTGQLPGSISSTQML